MKVSNKPSGKSNLRSLTIFTWLTDAFNLIGILSSRVPEAKMPEVPKPLIVCQKLMLRLSNDIHCVELLAVRSYPLQAMSIASSAYEVAYAMAYICDDEGLAQQWLRHADPTSSFRPAWELTHGGLSNLGLTASTDREEHTRVEYRVYRQLCWAKHANPILEAQLGIERRGNLLIAGNKN